MATDYRKTLAWQAAIDLGPQIVKLAEALPDTEQAGLAQQLRQLMVELPGAIALDVAEGSNVRLPLALRLDAALELVDRVYPALDAAPAQAALAKLLARLRSDQFDETEAAPAPVPVEAEAETLTEQPVGTEVTGGIHVQPDSGQ